MRFFAVALVFFGAAASFAQTPEVPHKMQFAGMTLTIRDDARREIQNDVDALTQHARYFAMKTERAKTYFPVIEKIFVEEGVPDDFKYLVLQESALVADAVSVSNAVGFWQFKDFTAMEMGLRVDKEVDERMNLVSATHAAAKYLKQNNYRFNNWLLALQAYQMGAGGVMRSVGDAHNGAKKMEITAETYWYVKKYLAHKVTFENALTGEAQLKVIAYQPKKRKTLKEIAVELSAEEEDLKEYNKWLKTSEIPDDKLYTVMVPVGKHNQDFTKLILSSDKAAKARPLTVRNPDPAENLPVLINSIPVIVARAGETVAILAQRGNADLSAFLKYNDIPIDHPVESGGIYFLGKKKTKGEQEFYKTKPGDDLWFVSQHFGVRIKNLKKYNQITAKQPLAMGTLIWLQGSKPKFETILPTSDNVATLEEETFDWYTKSPKAATMETVAIPKAPIIKPSVDSTIRVSVNIQDEQIQNGLKPSQIIKVGENELVKPEETNNNRSQNDLTLHEVKSTDTLYSIARQYGVTIKDIMDWNHKKDFSLSRGEKLEIRHR